MFCSKEDPVRILIVGGGTIGIGSGRIVADPDVEVISFDVYDSPNVQFLADAHQIPLEDSCVDGVWIQYVLEHVLEPWTVVAEIFRVLRTKGIIYSETPFLQQVHEGAYDFTRFTHSGHRWLFRNFDEISSGEAMGQGIQILWTVEHLTRGLFRSKSLGKFAKILFFWVQFLDRLIPVRFRMNSSSSFFFLGRKSERQAPSYRYEKLLPGELLIWSKCAEILMRCNDSFQ